MLSWSDAHLLDVRVTVPAVVDELQRVEWKVREDKALGDLVTEEERSRCPGQRLAEELAQIGKLHINQNHAPAYAGKTHTESARFVRSVSVCPE